MEQIGNPVNVLFPFTAGKVGKTGLTDVVANIVGVAPDLSVTILASGVACVELDGTHIPGIYGRRLANVAAEFDVVGIAITADGTVDSKHVYSLREFGHGGIEHLNADISAIPTTAAPTAAAVRAEMDSHSTKLDVASSAVVSSVNAHTDVAVAAASGGGGSVTKILTVTRQSLPAPGVAITVSTDEDGTNVVVGPLITDAFGQATARLNPGNYWWWAQRAGINFPNPQPLEVSA